MPRKPIIIVPGQPNSIFFEIFFKSLAVKKIISPIIFICCINLFKFNARKYRFNKNFNLINSENIKNNLMNNCIYILDVKLNKNKLGKIQFCNNKEYLNRCFYESFKLLKKNIT